MTTPTKPRISLHSLQRIVLDAASAHTVEEQIERLVTQVREAMAVSVCSLYQLFEDGSLNLVANEGFASGSIGRISLRLGQGLIGTIAASGSSLNLADAASYPAYRFFEGSGEEAYPAFLGVPIFHLGAVSGVLVVQDLPGRSFSDDEQSFLMTVAAQLGPVLLRLEAIPGRPREDDHRVFHGAAAATGKAIGEVHLVVSGKTLQFVDDPVSSGSERELQILEDAVSATRQHVSEAKAQLSDQAPPDVLEMFDFYNAVLAGDQLVIEARTRIQAGASAFAAVRATVDEHVHAFDAIEDEYLRARGEDIRHIGNRLLTAILQPTVERPSFSRPIVLLGTTISITDIGSYHPSELAAIVSLQGSPLSHAAVLARSLGIPAVMGIGPVDHIREGASVIVDGDDGTVILDPTPFLEEAYEAYISEQNSLQEELLAMKDLPAATTDGFRVTLLTNTGLLADAAPGKQRGAEGIGLYRSEFPFLMAQTLPSEVEQYATYRSILEMYHPLTVTMRTLDVGGDKQLPYLPIDELNPALGWRGIRYTLGNPTILRAQLRAMIRADVGLGNLRLLLPMVVNVAEVDEVQRILSSVITELREEGWDARQPDLGVMIEVPGAVALLPHLAGRISFVCIGTNDLTQYLLAADRDNPRIAGCYDHLHPGVLQVLSDVAERCRRHRLPATICGEMAADPDAIPLLIALGFTALSMSAYSLPRVRAFIRALSVSWCRALLQTALTLPDGPAIRAQVAAALEQDGIDNYLPKRLPV